MTKLNLPFHLEDKIFEIRFNADDAVSKVVSYFPLSDVEKKEIISMLNVDFFDGFHSIFSDSISEEEWNRTKNQIKKKFKDELFDVD
jgi:hypothetical protein